MYGGVFRFYGFFGAPGKVAKRFLKFCKVFLGPLVRWQKCFKSFFWYARLFARHGFLIFKSFFGVCECNAPTYVDIFGTIYTVFCQFQRKRKGVVRIMAALVWPL